MIICPNCGSEKVGPTKGNAVGNTMDCLVCYTDFTPGNVHQFSPILSVQQLEKQNTVLKAALCAVMTEVLGLKSSAILVLSRDIYHETFPKGAQVFIRDDDQLWAVRIEKK